MFEFFINLPPGLQALLAGLFTWSITALGAATVFLFKNLNNKILTSMLALAAGIMIASSFFSLLIPAIEMGKSHRFNWLELGLGFLCGGLLIIISDLILNKFFVSSKKMPASKKRSLLLFSSITLHNIPEGMAIGIAFGSIAILGETALPASLMLALGIGIQNFPEGAAVALPLHREGFSAKRAFSYGALSAVVETVFAPIACLLCVYVVNFMPFLLAFASGAMIAVASSELIPEACAENKNRATLFLTIGFVIMMILDIALS